MPRFTVTVLVLPYSAHEHGCVRSVSVLRSSEIKPLFVDLSYSDKSFFNRAKYTACEKVVFFGACYSSFVLARI